MSESDIRHCSFCGDSQHDVLVLVAHGDSFICETCIDLSAKLVAEYRARLQDAASVEYASWGPR